MGDKSAEIVERLYTVEDYFELEKHSEERHEYNYGKLELMPGESIDANRIGRNCEQFFLSVFDENVFDTFRNSIKLKIPGEKIYRYPDVMVVRSASIRHSHEVEDAELIVEIASEESYTRDHKTKLEEYTGNFPSLRYYLIIDQYVPFVSVYSRRENTAKWEYETFDRPDDEIPLDYFGVRVSLQAIYKKVDFSKV
jgi:Uma2 family endonuclease